MKKTLIYGAVAFLMLATSCKETLLPPPKVTAYADTSYNDATMGAETPQSRNVYIEEFTGVTCVNCPAGTVAIEGLLNEHPNIATISFHIGNPKVFNDPINTAGYVSTQDFRPAQGSEMEAAIWGTGIENKPAAVFDRSLFGQPDYYPLLVFGPSTWAAAYGQDVAKYPATSPMNIHISSTEAGDNSFNIVDTIVFTSEFTGAIALNVYVSEDNIKDVQELKSGVYDSAYIFNHVFRQSLTPTNTNGQLILPAMSTKAKGLVYVFRTTLKIDENALKLIPQTWNPDNMKVTSFISVVPSTANNNDMHVIQVQQVKLKGE